MDLTALYILRQLFVFCLVLGAIQETQSFDYSKEPDNPFIVVEGVNSTRVKLQWEFSLTSGESVTIINVAVDKPGEQRLTIGGKSGPNEVYKVEDNMKNKYELEEPATLVIKTVTQNEDGYRYIFGVFLQGEFTPHESITSLEVFVPAEFTLSPVQTTDVDIGKNVTLYCNASGDPHPNITWTKDGIPSRTFNVSGPVLHLPNVQRKDVGSYRCSAFNGYGPVISKVGLVNVKCPQRDPETVEITLTRSWKDAFGITSSVEYRDLSVQVTSEILAVYAEMSTLCRVQVVAFRSGSVRTRVELVFQSGTNNPLKPLEDEIKDGTLGTISVESQLIINPTETPPATTTDTTTSQVGSTSSADKRTGLTMGEMWAIIGACLAVLLIVVIIIIVVCCCKKKKGSGGGATKIRPQGQQPVATPWSGMATYSEADGYRMNRQYQGGAGMGSPAYVEASQYANANAVRKQNEPARQPPNYADLSFNNSSSEHKPPTNYPTTVYSEMSPSHQPRGGEGGGGQPGEKGFELWC